MKLLRAPEPGSPQWWVEVAICVLLFAIVLTLMGCGTDTRTDTRTERRVVTVTKEVRQELAPDGSIVRLETVTRTVTDENGQQIGSEEVTVRPPEVVGKIADLARPLLTAAATTVAGPVGGQVAQAGIDLMSTLLGTSAAAIPAGAGYMALRKRKSEMDAIKEELETADRHRNQLIDSVEAAREHLPDEIDGKFCESLGVHQDRDLQQYVQRRTS